MNLKLIIYKWELGVLNTIKKMVESVDSAVEHIADEIDRRGDLTARVINEKGELVHWVDHKDIYHDDDTYA